VVGGVVSGVAADQFLTNRRLEDFTKSIDEKLDAKFSAIDEKIDAKLNVFQANLKAELTELKCDLKKEIMEVSKKNDRLEWEVLALGKKGGCGGDSSCSTYA
jgi:Skp family chaperone for outer membrane proteins